MATERHSRDVWKQRVTDYRESGLTQQQWCDQNGCSKRALMYWCSKLRHENQAADKPEWLKLDTAINSDNGTVPEIAEIRSVNNQAQTETAILPNAIRITKHKLNIILSLDADDTAILRVLRLLEAI